MGSTGEYYQTFKKEISISDHSFKMENIQKLATHSIEAYMVMTLRSQNLWPNHILYEHRLNNNDINK